MFLAMILMLAIPAAAFAEPDEPGTTPSAKAYRVINEVTNAGISQMQAASDANMAGEDCFQMTVTPNAGYDFPATVSLYDGATQIPMQDAAFKFNYIYAPDSGLLKIAASVFEDSADGGIIVRGAAQDLPETITLVKPNGPCANSPFNFTVNLGDAELVGASYEISDGNGGLGDGLDLKRNADGTYSDTIDIPNAENSYLQMTFEVRENGQTKRYRTERLPIWAGHESDGVWHYDENEHWQACYNCGTEMTQREEHGFKTVETDTKKIHTCEICGYSYEEDKTPDSIPTPSVSPSVNPDVPAQTGDSSVLLTVVAFIFAASLALALIVYPKRSER